jgi:phosphoenolpyruvate synthase/pyruvate phosphate dikinase
MVRSDKSSVLPTIDPDTGFQNISFGSWGLGENIVQGNHNTRWVDGI